MTEFGKGGRKPRELRWKGSHCKSKNFRIAVAKRWINEWRKEQNIARLDPAALAKAQRAQNAQVSAV